MLTKKTYSPDEFHAIMNAITELGRKEDELGQKQDDLKGMSFNKQCGRV
ncbi:hypothetical protein IMZ48_01040 [Candidatus Bathyarchaeota archaeon]|nr:hypothetical protein [Candidatus Bathyarchaeota archaeon]